MLYPQNGDRIVPYTSPNVYTGFVKGKVRKKTRLVYNNAMPTRVPGLSRILYVHVTIYKRRRKKTKCKCSQTKKCCACCKTCVELPTHKLPKLPIRLQSVPLSRSNRRKVVDTLGPLSPNRPRCTVAGKVTVGLASHWLCEGMRHRLRWFSRAYGERR